MKSEECLAAAGRVGSNIRSLFQHAAPVPSYLGAGFVIIRDGGLICSGTDCLSDH